MRSSWCWGQRSRDWTIFPARDIPRKKRFQSQHKTPRHVTPSITSFLEQTKKFSLCLQPVIFTLCVRSVVYRFSWKIVPIDHGLSEILCFVHEFSINLRCRAYRSGPVIHPCLLASRYHARLPFVVVAQFSHTTFIASLNFRSNLIKHKTKTLNWKHDVTVSETYDASPSMKISSSWPGVQNKETSWRTIYLFFQRDDSRSVNWTQVKWSEARGRRWLTPYILRNRYGFPTHWISAPSHVLTFPTKSPFSGFSENWDTLYMARGLVGNSIAWTL